MCSKPNHFASVCRPKNKPTGEKGRKEYNKSHETDESEEEATDNEDPFFKIEEDSSVKTPGKQFNPKIIYLLRPKRIILHQVTTSVKHRRHVQCDGLRDLAV